MTGYGEDLQLTGHVSIVVDAASALLSAAAAG